MVIRNRALVPATDAAAVVLAQLFPNSSPAGGSADRGSVAGASVGAGVAGGIMSVSFRSHGVIVAVVPGSGVESINGGPMELFRHISEVGLLLLRLHPAFSPLFPIMM